MEIEMDRDGERDGEREIERERYRVKRWILKIFEGIH